MTDAGDIFEGEALSVANNAYQDIVTASSAEAIVHNICYTGAVEFYRYKTTNVLFDYDPSAGNWIKQSFHISETSYLRVKNVSGGVINISWDGIYTKGSV
jgi:hypothetical protein